MSEQGTPLTREQYYAAQWAAAEEQRQAAIAQAEQQELGNLETNGQQRQEAQQEPDDAASHDAGVWRPDPRAAGLFPGNGPGQMAAPGAGGLGRPPFSAPQIPVTDFSKGISYGTAIGIVVGGLAVIYLIQRSREDGGSSAGSSGGGDGST